MKKLASLAFITIFGLAACNGQASTTILSPVIPTLTLYPKLAPTLAPSGTSPLPEPTTTIDSAATAIAESTLVSAEKTCPGEISVGRISEPFSPNGQWLTTICSSGGELFLKFIKLNATSSWEVPKMGLFDWSKDGNYVYLIPAYSGDGPSGSAELLFNYSSSLSRLDLNDGNITTILRPNDNGGYTFSFSPENKYLIYSSAVDSSVIHLYTLSSGEDIKFKLEQKYHQVGFYSWSPDGSKVVFSAAGDDWYNFGSSFTLYMVDTKEKVVKLLLNKPPYNYYVEKWLSNTEILFTPYDSLGEFRMDINSKDIIQLMPTPTP